MESSLTSPMSPHTPPMGIWGSYGFRLFPDEDTEEGGEGDSIMVLATMIMRR